MRIKIVVILTLIVALTLVACGNNEIQEDANGQDYFNGEVLEVHDNYVQVECHGWTSEAYMIAMGESRNFDITWEWLYGALPAGTYRLTKGFMDFRGTGDYDTAEYWTEFVIEE